MGKIIKRVFLALLAAALAIILVYFGLLAIAVENQKYSWPEMDWNKNGKTTLREYFMSSEIGKRPVTRDGKICIEYFSYKDGSRVVLTCN